MALPTLSIITPSYNQAAFVEQTLRSVLEQAYPSLEYQVMDGGSTDGTVEILRRHGDRVRWVSGPDAGQAAALNEGFRVTSGEVVAWLNADDVYLPGALAAVGEMFARRPEVEWLYGRCPIIDGAGAPARGFVTAYKEFWMRRYSYRRLLVENFLCQPAVFFRRRLLDRAGPIDTRYRNAFDYELFLRMGELARPAFLDRELARFRVHTGSKTSSDFDRSFREERDAARAVARGRHPVLMARHDLNRVKLLLAYRLLRQLGR